MVIPGRWNPAVCLVSVMTVIWWHREGLQYCNAWADAVMMYPWFVAGHTLKYRMAFIDRIKPRHWLFWVLTVLATAGLWWVGTHNTWPKVYINDYGDSYVLFAVGTIAGTVLVYALTRLMPDSLLRFAGGVGKFNVLTLGVHPYLIALGGTMHITGSIFSYVWSAAIMLMLIPAGRITLRYAPWLAGHGAARTKRAWLQQSDIDMG